MSISSTPLAYIYSYHFYHFRKRKSKEGGYDKFIEIYTSVMSSLHGVHENFKLRRERLAWDN